MVERLLQCAPPSVAGGVLLVFVSVATTTACGGAAKRRAASAPRVCSIVTESADGVGSVKTIDGQPVRELRDLDGDGSAEVEARRHFDAGGREVAVELVHPESGVAVEMLTRTFDASGRVVVEEHDRWMTDGERGVDGVADVRRTFEYDGDRLVREQIDERDAGGLPGVDGNAEFRIEHEYEDGVRARSVRYKGNVPVQVQHWSWQAGLATEVRIDHGADGTDDEVVAYSYDAAGRLTQTRRSGVRGDSAQRFTWCE